MHTRTKRIPWMLLLGLTVAIGIQARAAHSKDATPDFDAEAKQAAQEAEQEAKDRAAGIKGKRQRTFIGTFSSVDPAQKKLAPDVVGMFVTNDSDKKPGRQYQVKLDSANKDLIDKLNAVEGKTAQIQGSLRVLDQNGEGKYLIAISVIPVAATRPAVEHRGFGSL